MTTREPAGDRIRQSDIRQMTIECVRRDGINLAQGVCDTEVPEIVRLTACQAIETGRNSYTPCDGVIELREAIAARLADVVGLEYDAEKQIVASVGSTGAFFSATLALLAPGDEVVLFEPYYGYHLNTVLANGLVPRFVRMRPPDWSFTREELEAAIGPKTRAVMVCSQANPFGKVWTREELELLAEVTSERELIVFSDEIYDAFVYDGAEHLSPASIPALHDRTVVVSGYSKTFAITGWRIGYAACKAEWAEAIARVADLVYVCPPAPLQHGVAAGLRMLGREFYQALRTSYGKKRDRICAALATAGLTPHVPRGAYYVLAEATRLPGATSRERAISLLESHGVASVPGAAFFEGAGGEHLLRFCFAKDDEVLEEACRRLEAR